MLRKKPGTNGAAVPRGLYSTEREWKFFASVTCGHHPSPLSETAVQVIITALCAPGTSLRQAIARDKRLEAYLLVVDKQQEPGREPGWLKLHSSDRQRGAINVQWDSHAHLLIARVVTRGASEPSAIIGDFITYLLARHSRRIKAITTAIVK